MSIKALTRYLSPLAPYLEQDGVTEICINRPQEIFVEQHSQFTCYTVPELNLSHLETLAELVAEFNHQTISPEKPLLSATLPGGERAQFVRSPACERDKLIICIRRHGLRNMTLADYSDNGAFTDLSASNAKTVTPVDAELLRHYHARDYLSFIRLAIKARKNTIISGGTGTGKTTFLNACLKEIPFYERLVSLEDAREVVIQQLNCVHLLAAKGDQGINALSMLDLFEACLRLRPDRILLSELRGKEAFPFLRAANSGHPGSLTTVHADTPYACFEQLVFMMQQAGTSSSDERLLRYIKSIIPIVIQLKRAPEEDRFMQVSEIYFDKAAT